MARRKTALLMTVGTGIGGQVATEDLAHAILFSIDKFKSRYSNLFWFRKI